MNLGAAGRLPFPAQWGVGLAIFLLWVVRQAWNEIVRLHTLRIEQKLRAKPLTIKYHPGEAAAAWLIVLRGLTPPARLAPDLGIRAERHKLFSRIWAGAS